MRKKNSLFFTEDEDHCIELKTIFGIKPGIYLTVYYAAIILVILFMILIFPGLKNYGSRISFKSSPSSVSVWIDNTYAGTTPLKVYVPSGNHVIEYRKPGFSAINEKIDVDGYLFATLFRKPEVEVEKKLVMEDYKYYLDWILNDLTQWGAVGSFHSSYQPEKILSESVKNIPSDYMKESLTEEFLLTAYKNVTDEYLLNDLLKAVYYYRSLSNPAVSPADYIETISYIAEKVTLNKKLFLYATKIMRDETRAEILPNGKSDRMFRSYEKKLVWDGELPAPYSEVRFRGESYAKVPSGRYLFGNGLKDFVPSVVRNDYEIPHNLYLESFFIGSREVTNSDYRLFIEENQKWDKSNKDNLINEGLVNEDYLKDWDGIYPSSDKEKNFPVRFVSYYAAEEYCRWLTGKLPHDMKDYSVTLPDEYQWEAAALSSQKKGFKLFDISGSLWEWCSNWYYPGDFISPSGVGTDLMIQGPQLKTDSFKSGEKSVRGGSWANSSVKISTRASQPPEWCTPFLGFRTALVRNSYVR